MADKCYKDMTDDELKEVQKIWEGHVDNAFGWASAYFAAKQLEFICKEGNKRGLYFINKFPIVRGSDHV